MKGQKTLHLLSILGRKLSGFCCCCFVFFGGGEASPALPPGMKPGTYCLYDMKSYQSILDKFLWGEHSTWHNGGLLNGIWSDVIIETSFRRYGKGPGRMIGLTLNEKSVRKWAFGLNICMKIFRRSRDKKQW